MFGGCGEARGEVNVGTGSQCMCEGIIVEVLELRCARSGSEGHRAGRSRGGGS